MKTHLSRSFLFLLLGCLLGPAAAVAKKPAPPPVVVPTNDDTLKAIAAVSTDSKHRQLELSARAKAMSQKLAALHAKAKNPKIDMAEQLSKDEMDEFNLLSAQVRYLENAVVIEEVRQRHLQVAKDIYQASYFVATMASEYVAEKGALDDGFEDFCQAKAKLYLLQMPVALLFNAENYVIYQGAPKK
jgi:tRNA U34 5-carboxymethylaminomethyl modifying GTPase MnmE/TrmE